MTIEGLANLTEAKLKIAYNISSTIASKINVTPKGVRLSEKLQLTAALCDEIWPQ